MATLTHELLSSEVSIDDLRDATTAFSIAVSHAFRLGDARLPPEQVIQVLRKAKMIMLDSHISYSLARCLAARFQITHEISDYDEAIAIVDKIIAAHSPGDSLTPIQGEAIRLIEMLVTSRLTSYLKPEYLEDAIHRLRALLCLPSLPDERRSYFTTVLDNYLQQRFDYFGVTGGSEETPSKTAGISITWYGPGAHQRGVGAEEDPRLGPQMIEKMKRLSDILTTIKNDEMMDVEAAVNRSRTLLPSQHSSNRLSHLPATVFAEAITIYRDCRKVATPRAVHFEVGHGLLRSLYARFSFSHLRQDYEEFIQLSSEVVNDGSAAVFCRFYISRWWAILVQRHAHSSISIAYETTMSLMQETLFFSPTLQIQHFRLTNTLKEFDGLASDYASYLIEIGQFKQAMVILERGRALLWSEMRGLRTPTDRLRAADPALAERFTTVNQDLEMVMMSVAQSEST